MSFRFALAVVFPAALIIGASPASAVTVWLEADPTSIIVGADVDVLLMTDGLGDAASPSLGVFNIDVLFDGSALAVSAVAFGDPVLGDQLDLTGSGPIAIDTLAPGVLNLFELSNDDFVVRDALQPGSFALAKISLTGLAPGLTDLSLVVLDFADTSGQGDTLVVTTRGTSVLVSAIPEPTAAVVFAAGMLVAAARLRGSRSLASLRH